MPQQTHAAKSLVVEAFFHQFFPKILYRIKFRAVGRQMNNGYNDPPISDQAKL
jgi:hypothetical protein